MLLHNSILFKAGYKIVYKWCGISEGVKIINIAIVKTHDGTENLCCLYEILKYASTTG